MQHCVNTIIKYMYYTILEEILFKLYVVNYKKN